MYVHTYTCACTYQDLCPPRSSQTTSATLGAYTHAHINACTHAHTQTHTHAHTYQDAMATEKLADGIRKFAVDLVALEEIVRAKLQ
jgi:transaldolase